MSASVRDLAGGRGPTPTGCWRGSEEGADFSALRKLTVDSEATRSSHRGIRTPPGLKSIARPQRGCSHSWGWAQPRRSCSLSGLAGGELGVKAYGSLAGSLQGAIGQTQPETGGQEAHGVAPQGRGPGDGRAGRAED